MTAEEQPQKPTLGSKYKTPPEVIESDTITLRRWRLDDVELQYEAAHASIDELKPYMAWAENGYTLADSDFFMNKATGDWDRGMEYNYAVMVDGKPNGSCGLMKPFEGDKGFGIGYWVATPVAGRGVGKQLARMLTKAALDAGAESVQIWHDLENKRSEAIPKGLGYTSIGERPSPIRPDSNILLWQLEAPKK